MPQVWFSIAVSMFSMIWDSGVVCVCLSVSRAGWLPTLPKVGVILPLGRSLRCLSPSRTASAALPAKLRLPLSRALLPPHVLGRIETRGDRPRILISHSRHVVSSFILVHLLHAQVAVELLSFYVNKRLFCEGRCYAVNICCKLGSVIYISLGEYVNWAGFGKATVEQETKWNFSIFFSTSEIHSFQLLPVKIQRLIVHSYLEYQQFLLTINIVLCWLYSHYYLFLAFMFFFFLQGNVWSKIGSFSSAIYKLMEQSKKM